MACCFGTPDQTKGDYMDRQMAGQWGAMEAARDFLEFVLDDGRTMSLSSYLEEIRLHCLNLVRALLLEKTAGAWYVTLFVTIMSGVCEIARLFVADTAPVDLPPLVNSAGWEAYLKASPLAMGAFGVIAALVGYVLYWTSLEKFKARRGMRSIYPQYQCSYLNLAFSILVSGVPIAGIVCAQSGQLSSRLTLLFGLALILSFVRILTLASRSMYKIVIALLLVFDMAVACVVIGHKVEPLRESIISLSVIYFLFHVIWVGVLGINELRITSPFRIPVSRAFKMGDVRRAAVCRTPKQWAGRSLSFFVVQLICLFIALCIIMMVPPYFISFNVVTLSSI